MNPFRNALTTYDTLPTSLRPKFVPALFHDWSDLEHNGNPVEHEAITDLGQALDYVRGWEDDESNLGHQFLLDMALAWDHILPRLPEPETVMFAGEKVSTGHYLSVDESEWPDEVTDDYTVTFVVGDVPYAVHIVNHIPEP